MASDEESDLLVTVAALLILNQPESFLSLFRSAGESEASSPTIRSCSSTSLDWSLS